MAAEVEVRLLGEPGVMVAGRPVDALASPRLLSLLTLLILNRATPLTRQRAAFTLWPDVAAPAARSCSLSPVPAAGGRAGRG